MNVFLKTVFLCLILMTNSVLAVELPDFTQLVKEASPAVVNISTEQNINNRNQLNTYPFPHQGNEEIPEIFRHFFGMPNIYPHHNNSIPRSLGSGFIISSDGYLLTNYHVIAGSDKIIVTLSDRRELEAKLIGSDKPTDVALLKVDAGDLPVVRLGRSDNLEVGEWVLAIGSPFGFDHSVTAGIVSAKQRALAHENYVPFIQTDVAINPGNSGGPLFNLNGEVIGINSQIYTRSGGFMGVSFAIPIDVVMDIVKQLKESGRVIRGWLGVFIQEIDQELAESYGLNKPAGALIAKVIPNSPAAKANLLPGDIILEANQRIIKHSSDLPTMIGSMKPNEVLEMKILRNGEAQIIKIIIGILPNIHARTKR